MLPVLVDANVLIDIFSDDEHYYKWSKDELTRLYRLTTLHINSVVYAEISVPFLRIEELEDCLSAFPIRMSEIPREALFLAGKAFVAYRRAGGVRTSPLPDFFIGAHAAVKGWQILTRDPARFSRYFPSVPMISPAS